MCNCSCTKLVLYRNHFKTNLVLQSHILCSCVLKGNQISISGFCCAMSRGGSRIFLRRGAPLRKCITDWLGKQILKGLDPRSTPAYGDQMIEHVALYQTVPHSTQLYGRFTSIKVSSNMFQQDYILYQPFSKTRLDQKSFCRIRV